MRALLTRAKLAMIGFPRAVDELVKALWFWPP
jgi:hypothetical protein